jgi:hypothetical protein
MRRFAALAVLALSTTAHAQQINLSIDPAATGGLGLLDEQQIEGELNQALADTLKLGDQDQFTRSMAEAASISIKGLGVDYASNIEKFVVGVSVSSGAHEAGVSFKKGDATLPKGGFAGQLTLMAGLNLGLGGKDKGFFDRFRVYANGMTLKLPSSGEFGGNMANVGGHLQIKLIGGLDGKLVEWGGVDITSGFEYTTYALALRSDLALPAPIAGGNATWNASGAYDLQTVASSVPIEASTNLRVAVATVFLGGAYDINNATTHSDADLSGPITATIREVDIENERIGSASLNLSGAGSADPQAIRIFVGAQANVLMFKGYGHLNIGMNGALGGHLGLRVAM